MDHQLRKLERGTGPKNQMKLMHARLRVDPSTCPRCQEEVSNDGCCGLLCYWWETWKAPHCDKPKSSRCLDCPRPRDIETVKKEIADMPTMNQLMRNPRRKKHERKTNRALKGSPFQSGVVLKLSVYNPKKPNSGNKTVARVRLRNGIEITAHVPGQGVGNVQEHSHVLVRGGHVPDTPGVNYTIVRGTLDALAEERNTPDGTWTRRNKRSKYGAKKPKAK